MSLMKAVNKGCSGTYKKCLLASLFPTTEVMTIVTVSLSVLRARLLCG